MGHFPESQFLQILVVWFDEERGHMLRKVYNTIPIWMAALTMVSFAVGGTYLDVGSAVEAELRIAASVNVVLLVGTLVCPRIKWLQLVSGAFVVTWLVSFGLFSYLSTPSISVFALLVFVGYASMIAFGWPIAQRPTPPEIALKSRSSRLRPTGKYSENTSAHFSPSKAHRSRNE